MKSKRVLVVDDKEENLYFLKSLLEGYGYTVDTVFKVYFPRVTSMAPELAPPPASSSPARVDRTILLVEDQDAIRRVAAQMIELMGHTVLVAPNGVDALQLLERHQGAVHLVMTDIVMPRMSGPALAERLRVTHPSTKILYASGYGGDFVGPDGELAKGAAFIAKPYSFDDLSRKLQQVLES